MENIFVKRTRQSITVAAFFSRAKIPQRFFAVCFRTRTQSFQIRCSDITPQITPFLRAGLIFTKRPSGHTVNLHLFSHPLGLAGSKQMRFSAPATVRSFTAVSAFFIAVANLFSTRLYFIVPQLLQTKVDA